MSTPSTELHVQKPAQAVSSAQGRLRQLHGDEKSGVIEPMRRIERLGIRGSRDGEKGLVSGEWKLSVAVKSFHTTPRTLNWILGLVSMGGAIAVIPSIAG